MFNITTKLEINIRPGPSLSTDMNQLPTFMIKSRIPVLICHPSILEGAMIERLKTKATYKIYSTVDFDNGKRYAMDKFLDLPKQIFECDGLEILLTANRTDKESFNEMRAIKEYASRLNSLIDVRWVLGLRTRTYESVTNIMKHTIKIPASVIRTDTNIEIPAITTEDHQKDIDFIKQHVATQIKISGNITIDVINNIKNASKFDVSVLQAKRIVKSLITDDDKKRSQRTKELEEKRAKEIEEKAQAKTALEEAKAAEKAKETTEKPKIKKSLMNVKLEGKLGKSTEEDAKAIISGIDEGMVDSPSEEEIIEEISDN